MNKKELKETVDYTVFLLNSRLEEFKHAQILNQCNNQDFWYWQGKIEAMEEAINRVKEINQ